MRGLTPWLDGERCGLGEQMPDFAAILQACLDDCVAVGSALESERAEAFFGESLPNATASRLAEFRAGRQAARRAMTALGAPPVSIPMANDRSPIWPAHLVGSISHCKGACLAVVAYSGRIRSLGLDVEPIKDLPPDIWDTIFRPEEVPHGASGAGRLALQTFVAKEAVYKAQYPVSNSFVDFQAIRIRIVGGAFTGEFMIDVPKFPKGTQLAGVLVEANGFLAAVVTLPWQS